MAALPYRNITVSNSAILVNDQPCSLTHVSVANLDTADRFLHVYNAAAASDVSVGSDTPKQSFLIPLGDGTDHGVYSESFPSPVELSTGMVIAATTTVDGGTAPTNDLKVNIGYA